MAINNCNPVNSINNPSGVTPWQQQQRTANELSSTSYTPIFLSFHFQHARHSAKNAIISKKKQKSLTTNCDGCTQRAVGGTVQHTTLVLEELCVVPSETTIAPTAVQRQW